jgi:hypothetical protein
MHEEIWSAAAEPEPYTHFCRIADRLCNAARISISCPRGTSENSPAFPRLGALQIRQIVPSGTTEGARLKIAPSSVPSGLCSILAPYPVFETLGYYRVSLPGQGGAISKSQRPRRVSTSPALSVGRVAANSIERERIALAHWCWACKATWRKNWSSRHRRWPDW